VANPNTTLLTCSSPGALCRALASATEALAACERDVRAAAAVAMFGGVATALPAPPVPVALVQAEKELEQATKVRGADESVFSSLHFLAFLCVLAVDNTLPFHHFPTVDHPPRGPSSIVLTFFHCFALFLF
jgi:hypothetical protein